MNYDEGEGKERYENTKKPNILSQIVSIFHVRKKTSSIPNHKNDFEPSYETDIQKKQDNYHHEKLKPDIPNHLPNPSKKSNDLPKKQDDYFPAYEYDKELFPLINSKKEFKREKEKKIKEKDEIDFTETNSHDFFIDKNEEINKEETRFKKEIEYSGLKNQGATCYLNTILQTLFHIPAFRKLIFEIPFDVTIKNTQSPKKTQDFNGNKKDIDIFDFHQHHSRQQHNIQINDQSNAIFNLQALFAQLQMSKEPISTQNLTTSFGWNYEQTQIQQDIQEFCIYLLDYIKDKLKGTPYAKVIDDLFMVHTRTYYRGINIHFEETSDDNFLVLSVVVDGFSTLNESLHSLLKTQYLKEGNQYESQKYGKQDVKLKTKFLKFPKVLLIHLKRFEFDTESNRNQKINSILMFKEELDISEFLFEKDSEQQELESEYELHGVLVHDGFAEGGHYFAYIRPSPDQQWYRFNDSSVIAVDKYEAIDNNFGGPDLNNSHLLSSIFSKDTTEERSFSAYMLVYVRKSSVDEIFCNVDNSMISEKVKNYLIDEKKIKINIVDEKCLAMNALKGRVSFYSSKNYVKQIYVSNSFSTEEFFQSVATQLKIKNYFFNLYKFDDDHLTEEINQKSDKSIIKSLKPGSSLFCSILDNYKEHQNSKLVFMFIYICLLNHPLRYLTKTSVDSHWPILETLQKKIKQELNLTDPFTINIYVKNGPVLSYIEDEYSFFDNYQSDMYIIDIFESNEKNDIIIEKGFMRDDDKKYSINTINYFDYIDKMPNNSYDYFQAINDKSKIKLKTIEKFDSPIQIKYTNVCSFGEFLHFIRKVVGANEDQKISIYKSYEVLPISQDDNLSQYTYQVLSNAKYLIVNASEEIEDNTALLEIIFSIDSLNQNNRFPLLVRKEMTVNNILNELKNGIKEFKTNKDMPLRLLQMNEKSNEQIFGITRVLNDDESAYNLKNPLRVEPIPYDQFDAPPENLIPVLFYNRNTKKTVNFLITVIFNEEFADTKKRIQSILNADDNSMEMMKFYLNSNDQKTTLKNHHIISDMNLFNCQIKITQMSTSRIDMSDLKIYN